MTVPPIILLSVWEQNSSSTGNNASQPQTSSAPTVLPTAPPTSLSLSPSRQFYTSLLCLSLFPFFSSVFASQIFIKPPLQPTFLESHACMWQCFLWHLPLCYVVCNYRLCSAKESNSPWVKGVPVGASGPFTEWIWALWLYNYAYSSSFHLH